MNFKMNNFSHCTLILDTSLNMTYHMISAQNEEKAYRSCSVFPCDMDHDLMRSLLFHRAGKCAGMKIGSGLFGMGSAVVTGGSVVVAVGTVAGVSRHCSA
jgi:hypothetical protein